LVGRARRTRKSSGRLPRKLADWPPEPEYGAPKVASGQHPAKLAFMAMLSFAVFYYILRLVQH